MKECSKCGGFIDGGEKRCPICNTRLQNRPSATTCPQCRSSVSPGDSRCQTCGTRFGANTSAAAPRYTQNRNSAPPPNSGGYIPGYSESGLPYRPNMPTAQKPFNAGKGIAVFLLLFVAISVFMLLFVIVFSGEFDHPADASEEEYAWYDQAEQATTYPVENLLPKGEAQFFYKQGVYEEICSMEVFRTLEPINWTAQSDAAWDFQSILTPASYSLQVGDEVAGAYLFIQAPCYFSSSEQINSYFSEKAQLLPEQHVQQYLESAFPLAGEIEFFALQEYEDSKELQTAWQKMLPQEGVLAKTTDMQFVAYQSTGKINLHTRGYSSEDTKRKQSSFCAEFAYCSFQLELEGELYSVWGIPYFRMYLLEERLLQTVYLPIIRTIQDNLTLNTQFMQAQREVRELWLEYAKEGRIYSVGHASDYLTEQIPFLPAQYVHNSFFTPDAITKALHQPDCNEYQITQDWSVYIPDSWSYVWTDIYNNRFLLSQNSYVTPWDYVDGTEYDWKEWAQPETEEPQTE